MKYYNYLFFILVVITLLVPQKINAKISNVEIKQNNIPTPHYEAFVDGRNPVYPYHGHQLGSQQYYILERRNEQYCHTEVVQKSVRDIMKMIVNELSQSTIERIKGTKKTFNIQIEIGQHGKIVATKYSYYTSDVLTQMDITRMDQKARSMSVCPAPEMFNLERAVYDFHVWEWFLPGD